jgi:hypothetical protein
VEPASIAHGLAVVLEIPMQKILRALILGVSFAIAIPVLGDESRSPDKKGAPVAETCEHGVKKTICTRCNPKLAAVFKAKRDWCAEHDRPESQCAICHPQLKKQGIKP